MGPDLNFWIVAWLMMALAFVAAFLGILLGAKGLDRVVPPPTPADPADVEKQ